MPLISLSLISSNVGQILDPCQPFVTSITTTQTYSFPSACFPVVDAVEGVMKNPKKYLTKDRFNLVKDYYSVRAKKDEILRYKNVNQFINPTGWSVYDILDKITLKKVLEVYDKYYQFDDFYISNDKKEFKK